MSSPTQFIGLLFTSLIVAVNVTVVFLFIKAIRDLEFFTRKKYVCPMCGLSVFPTKTASGQKKWTSGCGWEIDRQFLLAHEM